MTQPNQPAAEPTTVADELAALRRITSALDPLDDATRIRALRWLNSRYNPATSEQLLIRQLGVSTTTAAEPPHD